jgi:para-aminobenzoate synthetase component 1
MLELFQPDGAWEALDAYLEEELWGRPDRAADVFLHYGISAPLRRDATPAPPEPCRLPLVACSVRDIRTPRKRTSNSLLLPRFRVGSAWEATWADADYLEAVEAVRTAIARGDVYQVNLVRHLSAEFDGDPTALAGALAPLRPLHGMPLAGDGWTIVSASPELLLSRRGRRVWTCPIKGTRPAGVRVEGVKDAAEHTMIVDLERNDLSRVCVPGTVRWPELMVERELAGVSHLVSTVEGRLRDDATLAALLDAIVPGGSVTGAPKIAAVDLIAALEPVGRGASMGTLGTVWPNGDVDLALTIRTFAIVEDRIHLWVGGGIVWDSDPEAELAETWTKAAPLLAAIGAPAPEPAHA